MKPRTWVAIGIAAAAAVTGFAVLHANEPASPARSKIIYLIETQPDSSKTLDPALRKPLEDAYGAKVVVRAAASVDPLNDHEAVFAAFERTRGEDPASPIFFALGKPYRDTKKRLRNVIDTRQVGEQRIELLKRIVVVRDTEGLNEADACAQLKDDIFYAMWSFLGIGLRVTDGTLRDLKECVSIKVEIFIMRNSYHVDGAKLSTAAEAAEHALWKHPAVIRIKSCAGVPPQRVTDVTKRLDGKHAASVVLSTVASDADINCSLPSSM